MPRARFLTLERENQDYDTLHFFRFADGMGAASADTEKGILEAFVSPFWRKDKYQVLWEDMGKDDRIFTAEVVMDYDDLKKIEEEVGAIEKPKVEAEKMGLKTNISKETEKGVSNKAMSTEELKELILSERLKVAIEVAVEDRKSVRRKLHAIINLERAEKVAAAGVSY